MTTATALQTINPTGVTASLPTSLLPLISYETSTTIASDGQFDGVQITGCHIRPGATEADIRAGLAVLNEQFRPCGGRYAGEQLALLRARTKMRADQDGKLMAVAYIDWLAPYPADVAKAACEEWARGHVFFPAWTELEAICLRLMAKRKALRKALSDALEPSSPNALYLGRPKPESREERLRTIRDAWLKNANPNRAARAERELASLEEREPEAWAENLQEDQPQASTESAPFVPGNDAKTQRLRELAAKFRAKQEAEKRQRAEAAQQAAE